MGKIVRITESELTNLIKNILKENTQVCVTSDEIIDLLIKFKFQVTSKTPEEVILQAKPKKEYAHNIKYYEIKVKPVSKTVRFHTVYQDEINSPYPKMLHSTEMLKKLCYFKTINDFRRHVIDKIIDF